MDEKEIASNKTQILTLHNATIQTRNEMANQLAAIEKSDMNAANSSNEVTALAHRIDAAEKRYQDIRKQWLDACALIAKTEPSPAPTTELLQFTGDATHPFVPLVGANGTILMTNAIYRNIYGDRLVFSHEGEVRSFNVSDVSPRVLKALHIDQNDAVQAQMALNKQYTEWKSSYGESRDQLMIKLRSEYSERERRAAEQARQEAIAKRQAWEDSMRQQMVDNDTTKANAAMIHAQHPTQINMQQNTVNQQ